MNLPNKLTTIRLVSVPLFIIVYLIPYQSLGIQIPVFHILSSSLSSSLVSAAADSRTHPKRRPRINRGRRFCLPQVRPNNPHHTPVRPQARLALHLCN